MPCKHPASCNALECVAKPGKPDHVWPEEVSAQRQYSNDNEGKVTDSKLLLQGHLIVERCERFCWYCYRSKGKVNQWKYAW